MPSWCFSECRASSTVRVCVCLFLAAVLSVFLLLMPIFYFLSTPVLVQLQDNFLITSEEREAMSDLNDVFRVQRCKSSTVMFETAEILKKHGFQDFESQFLSGI